MISWAAVEKTPESVGRRVSVYWPADDAWYEGVIDKHRDGKGYLIKYDDGEDEWIKSLEGVKFSLDMRDDQDDEDVEANNTNEGLEHVIKSSYEESIQLLNESEEVGDAHWVMAKAMLVSLLDSNSVLSTSLQLSDKLQRIKYFIYKNLCQLEDKEGRVKGRGMGGNPQQALSYGLLALQMCELPVTRSSGHSHSRHTNTHTPLRRSLPPTPPPLLIPLDPLLLARVASLAVQVGDLWTCHALLFSGLLKDSMDHIKLDLYETWTNAMTTTPKTPPLTAKIPIVPPFVVYVTVVQESTRDMKPQLLPLLRQLLLLAGQVAKKSSSCGGYDDESGSVDMDSAVHTNMNFSVYDSVHLAVQSQPLRPHGGYNSTVAGQNTTGTKREFPTELKGDVLTISRASPSTTGDGAVKVQKLSTSVDISSPDGAYSVSSINVETQDNIENESVPGEAPTHRPSGDNMQQVGKQSVPPCIITDTVTDASSTSPSVSTTSKATSAKSTVAALPKTDRQTRKQRQDLLDKEQRLRGGVGRGVGGGARKNNGTHVFSIGSVEWEKQQKEEFEKHFASLKYVFNKDDDEKRCESFSTDISSRQGTAVDRVDFLLDMLQLEQFPVINEKNHSPKTKNTQEFLSVFMPVATRGHSLFPSISSVPAPLELLQHAGQVKQRQWVQAMVQDTPVAMESDKIKSDSEMLVQSAALLTDKSSCGADSEEGGSSFLAKALRGADWADFTQLYSSQLPCLDTSAHVEQALNNTSSTSTDAVVSVRIVDLFISSLSSMAKTVVHLCMLVNRSEPSGDVDFDYNRDDDTGTLDSSADHMAMLRAVVLGAWRVVVDFHDCCDERVVRTLSDDEALVLGECLLCGVISARLNSQQGQQQEEEQLGGGLDAKTAISTLLLLVQRWELMQRPLSPFTTTPEPSGVEDFVRKTRIYWFLCHFFVLFSGHQDSEDIMTSNVTSNECHYCGPGSSILENLLLHLGGKEVRLPHLKLLEDSYTNSSKPSSWCTKGWGESCLPMATVTDATPLGLVSRQAVENLQQKKQSEFLMWLQERRDLWNREGKEERPGGGLATAWQWLTRVHTFVSLPQCREGTTASDDDTAVPVPAHRYAVSSLYQQRLLPAADFLMIISETYLAPSGAKDVGSLQSKTGEEAAASQGEVVESLLQGVAHSRYAFLLVLFQTSMDCLRAALLPAESGEATSTGVEEVAQRVQMCVQLLVLLLSALETCECSPLMPITHLPGNARKQGQTFRIIHGVFLFLVYIIGTLPISAANQLQSICNNQQHVSSSLLNGLEVLINQWFLIIYSSSAPPLSPSTTASAAVEVGQSDTLSLRGAIRALADALRGLSLLPSEHQSSTTDSASTTAWAYLTYLSCCSVDLFGYASTASKTTHSLPPSPFSLSTVENFSAASSPKKRLKRSSQLQDRANVSAREGDWSLNVRMGVAMAGLTFKREGMLRLLGRLLGVEVVRERKGHGLRYSHLPAGRRAIMADYAYLVLSSIDLGSCLLLGGAASCSLQDLQVLPDGFAIFAGIEDLEYDTVRGIFVTIKKTGSKEEQSLREVASGARAPALASTLFECLKQILITMTEKLFVAIPSLLQLGCGLSSDAVLREEEGRVEEETVAAEIRLFEEYLLVTKHLYETWVSAKGLFFIDGGRLSLYLAEALMSIIKQAFRCSFCDQRDEGWMKKQGAKFQGHKQMNGSNRVGDNDSDTGVDGMEVETEQTEEEDEGQTRGPFIEELSDEVIMTLLTLIGQIYFDVFKLPIATAFIKFKESSMQADISQVNASLYEEDSGHYHLYESLFSFIKYCEDDLGSGGGVSKADIRASYGMLYQAFPFLRSPGQAGDSLLVERERSLLACLFSSNCINDIHENSQSDTFPSASSASTHWSAFFVPSRRPDLYLSALVQGCYDKLQYYGLMDHEFKVIPVPKSAVAGSGDAESVVYQLENMTSKTATVTNAHTKSSTDEQETVTYKALTVVPFPLRGGDEAARRSVWACGQQRFARHPFFEMPPREAQLSANINLLINALIHYPVVLTESVTDSDAGGGCEAGRGGGRLRADCEHALIWFNLYDNITALITMCLDDIGYNIFPVENLDLGMKASVDDANVGDFAAVHPIHFSDGRASSSHLLHQHVACGTLLAYGDEAFADVMRRYVAVPSGGTVADTSDSNADKNKDIIQDMDRTVRRKEESQFAKRVVANRQYWDWFNAPHQVHDGGSEWKGPAFINILDGLPQDHASMSSKTHGDNRKVVEQVSSADLGILMHFAKLTSLIQTSENILQALLFVYQPIEQLLKEQQEGGAGSPQLSSGSKFFSIEKLGHSLSPRKRKDSEMSKVSERLMGLYETRCRLYCTLMKVYCKGSGAYRHAQRLAILSALAGMQAVSVMHNNSTAAVSPITAITTEKNNAEEGVIESEKKAEVDGGGGDETTALAVAEKLLTAPCSSEVNPPLELEEEWMTYSAAAELLDDKAVHLSPTSPAYFLPLMYGKLLYQHFQEVEITGEVSRVTDTDGRTEREQEKHMDPQKKERSRPIIASRVCATALRYLFYAQSAVRRAARADKAEKKQRAPVVAELLRVRLSVSMRFLMTLRNLAPAHSATAPALAFSEKALLHVLNHPLLQEGPRPPSSSFVGVPSKTVNQEDVSSSSTSAVKEHHTAASDVGASSAKRRIIRLCSSCAEPYAVSSSQNVRYADSLLSLAGNVSGLSRTPLSHLSDSKHSLRLCKNICGNCCCGLGLESTQEQMSRLGVQVDEAMYLMTRPESEQQLHSLVWEVIVNSMDGLLHCKTYDPFDFKSAMLLAQFVFGLSKVIDMNIAAGSTFSSGCDKMSLSWATPPANSRRRLQALGIELNASWVARLLQGRLMDKKRPQIVGLWVQEGSTLPLEQFLQRNLLYDYQRYKCLHLYLEVCHAADAEALPLLGDLMRWTTASHLAGRRHREGSSAVTAWVMRATGLVCVDIYAHFLERAAADEEAEARVGALAALNSWVNNAEIHSDRLYQSLAKVADTSYTLYEIFGKYFLAVERFLGAGNCCALYGILGNLLVKYYVVYSSWCTRRYEALLAIAESYNVRESVNMSLPQDYTQTSISHIDSSASQVSLTDLEAIVAVPSTAAQGNDGMIVIPLPDLIDPPSLRPETTALVSTFTASKTESSIIPALDQANPSASCAREISGKGVEMSGGTSGGGDGVHEDEKQIVKSGGCASVSSAEMHSETNNDTGGKNMERRSSTAASGVKKGNVSVSVGIASVVEWCRRQSAWQGHPARRGTSSTSAHPTTSRQVVEVQEQAHTVTPGTTTATSSLAADSASASLLQLQGGGSGISLDTSETAATGHCKTNNSNKRKRATFAVNKLLLKCK